MAGEQHRHAPDMFGVLFTFGNPLLDITAEVNEEFLKKYGLNANDAILADEKHKNMYNDLTDNFKVEYAPGGATQNVARVMQWMLAIPKSATYIGAIGKDKYGDKLNDTATEAGVDVLYQRTDKEPTGTCAVLLTDGGKHRSLCAYLAAANHFSIDHLSDPAVKAAMDKAKYFYVGGFPITHGVESIMAIAEHSHKNNKTFCFNLAAPFICSFFKDQVLKVMPYVDILFGNESEMEEFAKANNFKEQKDLKKIAVEIASLPKQNGKNSRIIVITQGDKPTIVYKNGEVTEFQVIHTEPDLIVDTNGAGDAFVGGFLSQLVSENSLENCIRCGNYAANIVIQRHGCTYPEVPEFDKTVI